MYLDRVALQFGMIDLRYCRNISIKEVDYTKIDFLSARAVNMFSSESITIEGLNIQESMVASNDLISLQETKGLSLMKSSFLNITKKVQCNISYFLYLLCSFFICPFHRFNPTLLR